MAKHGEFNHIEFPADDVERAKAFYSAVFGWQFRGMDEMPDYFLYEAGPGGLGGGIGKIGVQAGRRLRFESGGEEVHLLVGRSRHDVHELHGSDAERRLRSRSCAPSPSMISNSLTRRR